MTFPNHPPRLRVLALFAKRPGDNAQIETLARACGLPFEIRRLAFRPALAALPNLRRGGSLLSLTAAAQAELVALSSDVVIAAGKRSAPAALWLKRRTGARLVHLGRTWAPGEWFDAVVTTPQYGQPAGPNVTTNRFPLTQPPPPQGAAPAPDLAALPRPRLLVVAGGDAAGMAFDASAARALAGRALERRAAEGGSLMVATSPRTSPAAAATLLAALPADARCVVSAFGAGANRYRDFLAAADAALVTADSVSMIAEAAATGRPVEPFALPVRAEAGAALRRALRVAGLFDAAARRGLVDSGREIRGYVSALEAEGWLAGEAAPARMAAELAAAAARVRSLA